MRTAEKLFDRDVVIADHFRLRLTREVGADQAEQIVGMISSNQQFGDWRADAPNFGNNPEPIKVAEAVGVSLGTKVNISAVIYEVDGSIMLKFTRASEQEPTANGETKTEVPQATALDRSPEEAFIARLTALELECREADSDHLAAKEHAKELREIADGKHAELCAAIRKYNQSPGPLFNGQAKTGQAAAQASPDDSWKKTPLSELGLTETVLKKLDAAELTTVGQLHEFVQRTGQAGYTDPLAQIKGIGATTAEKISAALAEFWEARGMGASAELQASSVPSCEALHADDRPEEVPPSSGSLDKPGETGTLVPAGAADDIAGPDDPQTCVVETDLEKVLEQESDADADASKPATSSARGKRESKKRAKLVGGAK